MAGYRNIPTDADCYSRVARPGDRVFCISFDEMVKCGVSETYLKKALNLHRSGEVSIWSHHKEGKYVYLHFEGLRENYKSTINAVIFEGKGLTEWYQLHGRLDNIKDTFKQCLNNVLRSEEYAKGTEMLDTYKFDNGVALPSKHITKYKEALAWLVLLNQDSRVLAQTLKYKTSAEMFSDITYLIRETKIGLPKDYTKIRAKLREYATVGAITLISNKFGNTSSVKISDKAGEWLISHYAAVIPRRYTIASLFERYNEVAAEKGWKQLKTEKAIRLFLYQPQIQPKWTGSRRGELAAKEKFVRQNKLNPASCRDSLWYADGTKLNLYYQDEDGKMRTMFVYEVMDAYSEIFLGCSFGENENHQMQYGAFKMALKTSGHKPYELRFDGQGGHKKLEAGSFLDKIAKHAIRTAPYNGKSKTIESAFGRFQSQIMSECWFFTGQNIVAKKEESRSNMDMILDNKKKLPTRDEAIAKYLELREKWNNSTHHRTGRARSEMYKTSLNPKAVKVSEMEMVNLFWIFNKQEITFTASGLTMQLNNVKHTYEVFDANGMPSTEFLKNNVGRRFIVAYDPDCMDYVKFYVKDPNGDLRFYADAGTYLTANRALQDQTEEDYKLIRAMEKAGKALRSEMQQEQEAILRKYNNHPEQHDLRMPKVKGIERKEQQKKLKEAPETIGEYTKAVSNMDHADYIDSNFNEIW